MKDDACLSHVSLRESCDLREWQAKLLYLDLWEKKGKKKKIPSFLLVYLRRSFCPGAGSLQGTGTRNRLVCPCRHGSSRRC